MGNSRNVAIRFTLVGSASTRMFTMRSPSSTVRRDLAEQRGVRGVGNVLRRQAEPLRRRRGARGN